MLGKCHSVERRHGFALASGGDDHCPVLRHLIDLVHTHNDAFRQCHVSQDSAYTQNVFHASACYSNLASVFDGYINNLLQPMHVGCKGCDDDALIAPHEELIKAIPHLHLRVGVSCLLHIGGIAQQAHNAVSADFRKASDVNPVPANRGNIKFEVSRVNNHAQRRVDRQGNGIRNAVVHIDHFHCETSESEHTACLLREDLRRGEHILFFQFQLNKRSGQRRGVNGAIHFFQQMCHRADMVLMPMCQNEPPDFFRICFQITDVGVNHIHPVHTLPRKSHSRVHDNDVISVLEHRHVLSDLAKAAQWNNL